MGCHSIISITVKEIVQEPEEILEKPSIALLDDALK